MGNNNTENNERRSARKTKKNNWQKKTAAIVGDLMVKNVYGPAYWDSYLIPTAELNQKSRWSTSEQMIYVEKKNQTKGRNKLLILVFQLKKAKNEVAISGIVPRKNRDSKWAKMTNESLT